FDPAEKGLGFTGPGDLRGTLEVRKSAGQVSGTLSEPPTLVERVRLVESALQRLEARDRLGQQTIGARGIVADDAEGACALGHRLVVRRLGEARALGRVVG